MSIIGTHKTHATGGARVAVLHFPSHHGQACTGPPRRSHIEPASCVLAGCAALRAIKLRAGAAVAGECEGILCIKQSWPAAIRTLFEDQDRFEKVYFAPFPVSQTLG
jgi:acyl-coenzyme A synthetase/AMP-(fatty) acid ligase